MKRKRLLICFFPTLCLFLFLGFCSCSIKGNNHSNTRSFSEIITNDTLRVGMMYASTSYFRLKDEELGFDYELCKRFCEEKGLNINVTTASSIAELTRLLECDSIDLLAYRLPMTSENKTQFPTAGKDYITKQVLVQRRGRKMIHSVTDLISRKVVVMANSKYEQRLRNLNEELGGGIDIIVAPDTLSEDDLIQQVSNGEIEFTIAEDDLARMSTTYYRNLDCAMAISFPQRAAWRVGSNTTDLKDTLDFWMKDQVEIEYYQHLEDKYFTLAKYFDSKNVKIPRGALSPYDNIFREVGEKYGIPWQFLAAVAHEESRFDNSVTSWMGAQGVMQIMPSTARHYNVEPDLLTHPEENIRLGARILKAYNRFFRQVEDSTERVNYVLAAYNAGPAHILDAMALAKKHGADPQKWSDTRHFLLQKDKKEYYRDPVVKAGYFKADRTIRYVDDVQRTYDKYKIKK
ncbi:MAG: transglycosylase SLT domain-containing protein [Paludibacteraceae bacterium]|nr:transglycosylase SLT domain-containing protein [Paludibacteraceae bacterium]